MADPEFFEIGHAYTDPHRYESVRYRSLYGRFRDWRERNIFEIFLERTEPAQTLLDCPAGVGRLFPQFRSHGLKVIGADISQEMLRFAKIENDSNATGLLKTRGYELPFRDDAVDWVFSFALMKHLSPDAQMATLAEFWRVAREGVVVSFAILHPVSFPRWWLRYQNRSEGSFPIPELWLRVAAERLESRVEPLGRVLPGLGMETLYLLTSAATGAD